MLVICRHGCNNRFEQHSQSATFSSYIGVCAPIPDAGGRPGKCSQGHAPVMCCRHLLQGCKAALGGCSWLRTCRACDRDLLTQLCNPNLGPCSNKCTDLCGGCQLDSNFIIPIAMYIVMLFHCGWIEQRQFIATTTKLGAAGKPNPSGPFMFGSRR